MSLQLGDTVPNFTQKSTLGEINFYDWAGDNWVVLFSHPKDFTPVCTTELGQVAKLQAEWAKRGAKVIAVSVDPVDSHLNWLKDIESVSGTKMNYPVLADPDRTVSDLYQMIHPNASDTATVRSVFIIDPNKKLRLSLTYPASTGRNFAEILRVIDSLQLTENHSVSTPADWKQGEDVVISPKLQDPEELKRKFPGGYRTLTPYLRLAAPPTNAA
ncbi:MAG TPA: peroxiredoxin [Rhodothermales bacterium]|nr:peroxiredoxin [Rhodothermales bacterium]